MRKTTVAVVSALFCVFTNSVLANEIDFQSFQSVPQLSNPSLEKLARGFERMLRNDVSAPYNGEWGYVSRTKVANLRSGADIFVENVAYLELCEKLNECPDYIEVIPNTNNNATKLADSAGIFLYLQQSEENLLRKLRHLVSKSLKTNNFTTYTGVQQGSEREGAFAALFDPNRQELLIIGSNTRP